MDRMILRVGLIMLHALANIVVVSYLVNYDITSSWLATISFVIILFILLTLFIKHIMSFIKYIKTN